MYMDKTAEIQRYRHRDYGRSGTFAVTPLCVACCELLPTELLIEGEAQFATAVQCKTWGSSRGSRPPCSRVLPTVRVDGEAFYDAMKTKLTLRLYAIAWASLDVPTRKL